MTDDLVKILDGNHLEATEHRLPELRTTWAAPAGNRSTTAACVTSTGARASASM